MLDNTKEYSKTQVDTLVKNSISVSNFSKQCISGVNQCSGNIDINTGRFAKITVVLIPYQYDAQKTIYEYIFSRSQTGYHDLTKIFEKIGTFYYVTSATVTDNGFTLNFNTSVSYCNMLIEAYN